MAAAANPSRKNAHEEEADAFVVAAPGRGTDVPNGNDAEGSQPVSLPYRPTNSMSLSPGEVILWKHSMQ